MPREYLALLDVSALFINSIIQQRMELRAHLNAFDDDYAAEFNTLLVRTATHHHPVQVNDIIEWHPD